MNEIRSRMGLYLHLLLIPLAILMVWNTDSYGGGKKKIRINACALVTQNEIDSLFSAPVGSGRSGVGISGFPECVWPAKGVPKFMLQVLPSASGKMVKAIDPGQGYRVHNIKGLRGEAAVAIQKANPKYGIKAGVAILAIKAKNFTLTFSPVNLDIQEGSPKFDVLKKIAEKAAGRI
jgi:hypothetical protein